MTRPIRKLAIVGASARAAAFSALRAGFQVVAADLFADADLARVCQATRIEQYPEGLTDWLAATTCDAWLYTGALENYPALVDRMAGIRPLLGNSGAMLRDVRDPFKLQAALAGTGVALPETRASAEGLPFDGSWLCKTYQGASGSGVWRLDDKAAQLRAEREGAVFQRFIPGESFSAIFLTRPGRAPRLGVTRQLIGWDAAKPFQYIGSIGPVALDVELRRQLKSLGAVLATRFELRGLVGADFVVHDRRVWIVEVNPRYTASVEILERAAGKSTLSRVVDWSRRRVLGGRQLKHVARGRPFVGEKSLVHGKAILFAPQAARISSSFFKWTMEQTEPSLREPWLADLPHEGDEIAAGRPILTVFATGATVEECEQALRERMAMVEWRPYGYLR